MESKNNKISQSIEGFVLCSNGDLVFEGKQIGKVYKEVDGYYIYEPVTNGQFNEFSLRLIADLLEKLNGPWDKQIYSNLSKYIEDDEGDCEAW